MISFPDILECLAQGEDLKEAYEMAVDTLGLAFTLHDEDIKYPCVAQ